MGNVVILPRFLHTINSSNLETTRYSLTKNTKQVEKIISIKSVCKYTSVCDTAIVVG